MRFGDPTKTNSERGAAIVEFVLVAPLLVMLLLAIVQFGITLNQSQGLQAAAREGARVASIPTVSADEIEEVVTNALVGINTDTPVQVAISPDTDYPCESRATEPVVVTVSSVSVVDIPFFAGSTIPIEGTGTFRCER